MIFQLFQQRSTGHAHHRSSRHLPQRPLTFGGRSWDDVRDGSGKEYFFHHTAVQDGIRFVFARESALNLMPGSTVRRVRARRMFGARPHDGAAIGASLESVVHANQTSSIVP